jgi:hypothetical protein
MYIETQRLYLSASSAAIEELRDIEAARAALAESDDRIPYEDVRRELGM